MRTKGPSRADLVAPIVLGAVLVGAPLLLGGQPGWATTLIAASAGVALVASATVASAPLRHTAFVAMAVGLAATLAQAVPLPEPLLAAVAPRSAAMAADAADALGREALGAWPISRSPAATRAAIVVGLAIAATFAAAGALVRKGQRARVLALVVASGLSMIVVVAAHWALRADAVFGLYRPEHPSTHLIGPLLDPNHLGGFLAMCVPIALGLGLDTSDAGWRVRWLGAAGVMTAAVLATLSRGAVLGLVVGLLVLTALLALRRRGRPTRRGRRGETARYVGAAGAVAVGGAVALYLLSGPLRADFESTSAEKLRLASRGLDLLTDALWTGVGRGAYSAAFVGLYGTVVRYEHPENWLVEWATGWGVPVTLVVIALMAAAWVRSARDARSAPQVAALAAIASIVAHDIVDFALEMPAVAAISAAVLACATVPSTRRNDRDWQLASARQSSIALGAVTLLTALTIGPSIDADSVRSRQARLSNLLAQASWDAFDREIAGATALHPSEPAFALLAAEGAVRRANPDAGRWLNRAMRLAPAWYSPHLLAARWLRRSRRNPQAWLEIEQAELLRPGISAPLACALLTSEREVDTAVQVFGEDDGGHRVLDGLADCPGLAPALTARIDRALEGSGLPGPRVRAAQRALSAGRTSEALRLLEGVEPDRSDLRLVLLRADAWVASGHAQEAAASLAEIPGAARNPDLLRRIAAAQAAAGSADAMRRTLAELRGLAAGSGQRLSAARLLEGDLERSLGNRGRAMQAYEQADRLGPSEETAGRIADLAESEGDLRRAYQARTEQCRRAGRSECPRAQALSAGPAAQTRELGHIVGQP